MGFSVYLKGEATGFIKIKNMNNNDTINTLTNKLRDKLKTDKLIICMYEGEILDKDKTLEYYKIKRHTWIEYSTNYRGGKLKNK